MSNQDIKNLEKEITARATEYYSGNPTITDNEFDCLCEMLREKDPNNKLLKTPGWGYVPKKHKSKHLIPMGSLDKIHSLSEYKSKNRILSLKLDGSSCELIYKNGNLQKAVTRGNGDVGVVVTKNLLHFIPTSLDTKDDVFIRGEVIVTEESNKELNGSLARNTANGLLVSLTYTEKIKHLKFIPFGVFVNGKEIKGLERYKVLAKYFPNAQLPFFVSDKDLSEDELTEIMKKLLYVKINGVECTLPYDGLVVEDALGVEKMVSYKFEDIVKKTKVTNITWQVSGNGRVIPVVHFNPVALEGANITKCTGNNVDWLKSNGVGIGADINVVRANMVIPKIKEVLKKVDPKIITNCPLCNTKLEKQGVHLVCINTKCSSRANALFERILTHFAPEGLGSILLAKLNEHLLGSNIGNSDTIDLIKSYSKRLKSITKENLKNSFGEKTLEKILKTIDNVLNKKIHSDELLILAKIPGVGHRMVAKMNEKVNILKCITSKDWKALMNAADNHKLVVDGLSDNYNQKYILALFDLFKGNIIEKEVKRTHEDEQILVVVTGSLSVPVKKWKDSLPDVIGVKDSVTNKVALLICNNSSSTSTKFKKAKSLGIPIINEKEFDKFLEKRGYSRKKIN